MPDPPLAIGSSALISDAVSEMKREFLPSDHVSRFTKVLGTDEFRSELSQLFLRRYNWSGLDEIRIHPFKAHDNRCTFEVSGRLGGEWRSVIAKVHDVDRSDAFTTLRALAASGFGPESDFSISQPLAYVSSLHVLFEEKIQGTWALDVFFEGALEEQIKTASQSGAWLGRFHSVTLPVRPTRMKKDLLVSTRYYYERIAKFGDSFASKSSRLLQHLESAYPNTRALRQATGHGSYIPEHVFVQGPRTIVIDIDEHDLADPARDLAWFVVSLQRLGLKKTGSLHSRDESIHAFLQAYKELRGEDAMKLLPYFRAAECLHRAHRDLYKRDTPIPQWADIMLEEGLNLIG